MKRIIILAIFIAVGLNGFSQTYPEPEFTNEPYFLNKGAGWSLLRLEKKNAEIESRTRAGGFGGSESAFYLEGAKSPVRIAGGKNLCFIFSTGRSGQSKPDSASRTQDSLIQASGVDPAMFQNLGAMTDPVSSYTLYAVETEKGARKIVYMKNPGALPFGSRKSKSAKKYSFSVRKIRDGYWELVLDESLPQGEYAFGTMTMPAMGGSPGGILLFAFGID